MKKNIITILLSCLWTLFSEKNLQAQNTNMEIKQLSIGDQCPNFQFNNILYGNTKSSHLSDYKGRILILDFWATWCGPCVSSMPHLDSLQKQFGDKIAVLQITSEDSTVVKNFKKNSSIIKNINLPTVTGKNVMTKYFPHYMIPHTIIIDEKGIVKSTTTPEAITKTAIESIITGHNISIVQKKDNMNYDRQFPLLFGGLDTIFPIKLNVMKYSSILTKKIDGLGGSAGGPEVYDSYSKISCTNTYIQHLYLSAFATKNYPFMLDKDPEYNLRFLSRIIWKAKDSTNFFWSGKKRADIDKMQVFTYELIAPREDSIKLNQYMIEDLNRYFSRMYHFSGKLITKKVKCLVLIDKKKMNNWKSIGGKQEYELDNNNKKLKVKNYPLSTLLFQWMNFSVPLYPLPIIDETGYTGMININLDADLQNIEAINIGLARYGLEFKEKFRKIKMILIDDVK